MVGEGVQLGLGVVHLVVGGMRDVESCRRLAYSLC